MRGRLYKLTLTTHVTVSVAWVGAVVAYLALAIAALASGDEELIRAAYLSMELIVWSVIVWLALGALVTGLIQALTSKWGLFRHYWVVAKLLATVVATAVLVKHMPVVSRVAAAAHAHALSSGDHSTLRVQLLVHAAGGLLVLLAVTAVSIYKPWGKTPFGRRKPSS